MSVNRVDSIHKMAATTEAAKGKQAPVSFSDELQTATAKESSYTPSKPVLKELSPAMPRFMRLVEKLDCTQFKLIDWNKQELEAIQNEQQDATREHKKQTEKQKQAHENHAWWSDASVVVSAAVITAGLFYGYQTDGLSANFLMGTAGTAGLTALQASGACPQFTTLLGLSSAALSMYLGPGAATFNILQNSKEAPLQLVSLVSSILRFGADMGTMTRQVKMAFEDRETDEKHTRMQTVATKQKSLCNDAVHVAEVTNKLNESATKHIQDQSEQGRIIARSMAPAA